MAEIVATFDTKDKTLIVSMGGKKMKDVTSVEFFKFGNDNAAVEIRSMERQEDEDIIKITKILANEEGVKITDTIEEEDLTEDLSKALFPKKYKSGV